MDNKHTVNNHKKKNIQRDDLWNLNISKYSYVYNNNMYYW